MTEFTNSVNNITTNQLLSTNTISSTLANVSTTTSTIPIATYLPWMFIEFSQLSTVIECGQLLYNKTFQGCKLNTYVYDYIAYLSGVYDDGWKIDTFSSTQKIQKITEKSVGRSSTPQRRKSRSQTPSPEKRKNHAANNTTTSSTNNPIYSNNKNDFSSSLIIDTKKTMVNNSYGLLLIDFVEKDQILDTSERDDIILDINQIFQSITTTSTSSQDSDQLRNNSNNTVFLQEITFWESFVIENTNTGSTNNNNNNVEDVQNDLLHVLVTFPSLKDCYQALSCLKDKVVAGSHIMAHIVCANSKLTHWQPTTYSTTNAAANNTTANNDIIRKSLPCQMIQRYGSCGTVLLVTGFANMSSELLSDTIKLKSDMLKYIYSELNMLTNTTVNNTAATSTDATNNKSSSNLVSQSLKSFTSLPIINRISLYNGMNSTNSTTTTNSNTEILGCIEFTDVHSSETAMIKLDGSIIGGHILRVYIDSPSSNSNNNNEEGEESIKNFHELNIQSDTTNNNTMLTNTDSPSSSTSTVILKKQIVNGSTTTNTNTTPTLFRHDSTLIKQMADIRSLSSSKTLLDNNTNTNNSNNSSIVAITKKRNKNKTKSKQNQTYNTTSNNTTSNTTMTAPTTTTTSASNNTDSANTSSNTTMTPTSKYIEAKTVPKLTKQTPTTCITNIPLASEDINETIKLLLNYLQEYQERSILKDPIKAKQKLRFIVGLKQVTNSVKSGRAKLVLLSPDTENCNVLDEKIVELMSSAVEQNIPIIYCLSRRKLGKAIKMTTKQTAIAIYDPSGAEAYQAYTKVLKFIEQFHKDMSNVLLSPRSSHVANEQTQSKDTLPNNINTTNNTTTNASPINKGDNTNTTATASTTTTNNVTPTTKGNNTVQYDDIENIQYIDDCDEDVDDDYSNKTTGDTSTSQRHLVRRTSITNNNTSGNLTRRDSTSSSSRSYNNGVLINDKTVVIDNGSFMMRVGYNGDDSPSSVFPSAVAMASFYMVSD